MKLSEPGRIGDLEIRNRIVMAPMISNLANPDGNTNDNHIAYLEERAAGGAGLIITEYTYVNNLNSRGSRNEAGAYNPDFTPKYRRLTDRIHSHGARTFMQLVHAGGKAFLDTNREGPMAPTATDYVGYTPREMTLEDIENVKEDFIRGARFAAHSQFDGIELHGAHGYLLQEFISPTLNRRSDRYGGSLENRLRFPQEIIDSIKGELNIPVGIRLSLYEDDPDGYTPEYGLQVAETLKGIDYAHFSAGRFAPPGSSSAFYGIKAHISARLPRKPKVTSIVVGSVTSLPDAEKVMEKSDFVAVGRAFLADPYFADKILKTPDIVRPCIRCNQACRDLGYGEVRCTVNPDVGYELRNNTLASDRKEVKIVGAGIKGLEAALTAAKAGMYVTIYDMRDEIGGQILDYADPGKKDEFRTLVQYYGNTLKKLGVRFELGKKYTEDDALYCLPDVTYPQLEGSETIRIDSNIYQYHDLALKLAGKHKVKMSKRSLTSLDRVRAHSYIEMARNAGVEFVEKMDETPSVDIMQRLQYDIRSAMVSGREALRKYLENDSKAHL